MQRYQKLLKEYEDTKLEYSRELMNILGSQKEAVEAVRLENRIKLEEAQKSYHDMLVALN